MLSRMIAILQVVICYLNAMKYIAHYNLNKTEISMRAKELALQDIIYVFERFGWNPPVEMIKKDQDNLMNRKFS